jgi:hypothetical protein
MIHLLFTIWVVMKKVATVVLLAVKTSSFEIWND